MHVTVASLQASSDDNHVQESVIRHEILQNMWWREEDFLHLKKRHKIVDKNHVVLQIKSSFKSSIEIIAVKRM